MKALILYDSYFGNTEKVAQAIADALAPQAEVTLARVKPYSPEQLEGVTLLVLGSPTRGFRPSEATQAFLNSLPAGSLEGIHAAAFDTRVDPQRIDSKMLKFMAKTFGNADKPMLTALEKKGARIVSTGQGFIVLGSEGPLLDGELERAAAWAATLL
jgi:flavodoxin